MFEVDRIFHAYNVNNGESGWYFQAREGIAGVYASMEEAQSMLKEYIKACVEHGNSGGRNLKKTHHEQLTKKSVDKAIFFNFRPEIRWH